MICRKPTVRTSDLILSERVALLFLQNRVYLLQSIFILTFLHFLHFLLSLNQEAVHDTYVSCTAFSQPRSRAWYLCVLHGFLSTKKPCMILMCLARLPHHSYLAFSEVCERLFDAACDPQEVDNRLNFFTKTVLSDFYSSLKSIWLAVGENNWQCKY